MTQQSDAAAHVRQVLESLLGRRALVWVYGESNAQVEAVISLSGTLERVPLKDALPTKWPEDSLPLKRIGEAGVRQSGLRTVRPRRQDGESPLACPSDPLRPYRGVADPARPRKYKRPQRRGHGSEELVDARELLLATDRPRSRHGDRVPQGRSAINT
jgi:hypothetical protein